MRQTAVIRENTRCALVYNPLAGGLRVKLRSTTDLEDLVDTLPSDVAICATTSRRQVDEFVVEAAKRDIGWLVVAGGDGTLFNVLNELYRRVPAEHWPVLSVLPAGSTNVLASLTGQPREEQVLPLLAAGVPDVGELPRLSVRLLKVNDRWLCVLACAGFFVRVVSAYVEGAPRYVGPISWTVLHAIAVGAGVWFPEWLRSVDPVNLVDEDGCPLRLPDGRLPAGVACTADRRVAELWPSYLGGDDHGGVQAVLAGSRPDSAVREAVAATLMRSDTPKEAVAESHRSITIESRTQLLLDGEFISADAGARVEPGPTVELADLREIAR